MKLTPDTMIRMAEFLSESLPDRVITISDDGQITHRPSGMKESEDSASECNQLRLGLMHICGIFGIKEIDVISAVAAINEMHSMIKLTERQYKHQYDENARLSFDLDEMKKDWKDVCDILGKDICGDGVVLSEIQRMKNIAKKHSGSVGDTCGQTPKLVDDATVGSK